MKPFQPLYIHNEKTNATSVQISLEEWEGILNEKYQNGINRKVSIYFRHGGTAPYGTDF